MVFQSIEDPQEFSAPDYPKKASGLRRILLAAAGVAAVVAGAFLLTHREVFRYVDQESVSIRRRLAAIDADETHPAVQQFIDEMLPVLESEKALNDGAHARRRMENGDERYIQISIKSDIFYVVNIFDGLGKYLCAITKNEVCDEVLSVPGWLKPEWITDLLQALRDSDDGLDQVKRFDDAALAIAHGLVDKGAAEAQDAVDHLDTLFDVNTALAAAQITGNIAAAILSFTPFAAVGATFSFGLNAIIDVVKNTVTDGEIDDAKGSVAAEILDMGKYADETPLLDYLKRYHDAEKAVTVNSGRLYMPGGPLAVASGTSVATIRRFLTGLARGTDSIDDMYMFLMKFHNSFIGEFGPKNSYTLWKDLAYSMDTVDQDDVTTTLSIVQRAEDNKVEGWLFDSMSNVFLATGFMTSKKAKTWSQRTYAYKANNPKHPQNAKLFKLRAMSENPKAPRKALMYSRATAGLSILGAVVQGISLGFSVAEQETLVNEFNKDIQIQKANIKAYYTSLREAVQQLLVTDPLIDSHTSFPTPAPSTMPTRNPTGTPTVAPTFSPGNDLFQPCSDIDVCRGDLYCMPIFSRCGDYADVGGFCDMVRLCKPGLECVNEKCE